ncbi:hypothetical protein Tco_1345161 [Tanacetum coccineum]
MNHCPLGRPPGKLKAARYLDFGLEELVPSLWVESEREYDISAVYGITHWWFRRKEFYINKHSGPLVVSNIIHPNDFEDLFLLNIQEKLNHLPKTDKTSLSHGSQHVDKNLVISNRDLLWETYSSGLKVIKQVNLERPNWDAADYYFKEDYTIVPKPRAVVYRDRNNQRKLMRLNELHKFSDGTLTRVMEKLDQMVKDFHLYEYNKGMETRKWSEDDKRRSKDFITAIEKRLQIRRIYRSLESFVGGRIRDIDYRLINRTTLILKQVASAPATDYKPKRTIESRAKRSSLNLVRNTYPIPLVLSQHCGNKSILRDLRIIHEILKDGDEMENVTVPEMSLNNRYANMTYTCYDVMKDLIKVSKLPQTLMSSISSQVHKMAIHHKMMMSTLVFVDLDIPTQADGAQSLRVPVPLPKDPYEAIRPAYLVDTETPESPPHYHPLTHASPTLVPFLRRTARIAMRVPPAMSPSLSASISEVAAMSDSAFRKRFRSSYESSPSSSPPDLPSRKRYRGTSELVEDDEDGEDEDEEDEEDDEEIEESLDSDSESEDAEDEGPTAEVAKDEDPSAGDEGCEGQGSRRSYGSVPDHERPERVSALRQPILTTWIDLEDDRVYIDVPIYPLPAPPVQTPPSPEWSSSSLPISPAPSIVPSPISSPMIPLTVPSPVASPATAEAEGFLTKLGARVEMQGGLIHDHTLQLRELSPALFERYDRVIGELFTRSRAVRDEIFSQRYRFRSQEDAQRSALWHAISDMQMENRELRLQIIEERRARLDLAEIVDSMRRVHEPRGDV